MLQAEYSDLLIQVAFNMSIPRSTPGVTDIDCFTNQRIGACLTISYIP